mmetsp:Transcript_7655/g.15580  ORF Transcript_7655/g.15580 Transcript_7655/m.15580 type:complete len:138 (-) Transcript_7655:236-649(-)|eukprot:CAMPEP_0118933714 /NCGR_PEP_ID=MMETSP1169-20130426/12272_1 /TAXON_ID=36882 /ORGANISM="Pyramimonas obovata, Strain CCMP722" /LENGTH=137 /DNA_ID=CAMNT_0006876519 /DNA_START=468 /DNA_END=881 /DNA_ORIENTATION=+
MPYSEMYTYTHADSRVSDLRTTRTCYQVLNLDSEQLLATCPRCAQVSSALPDSVVACPSCGQHMLALPTAGRFHSPIMADPKDVREIAKIMPHLSVYHIATGLTEANYNTIEAVKTLAKGKELPEVNAWLAANTETA